MDVSTPSSGPFEAFGGIRNLYAIRSIDPVSRTSSGEEAVSHLGTRVDVTSTESFMFGADGLILRAEVECTRRVWPSSCLAVPIELGQ